MDTLTPEQRYRAMASNRGRTKPERRLARELWHAGVRYLTAEGYEARYKIKLAGHPDIIFSRHRVVVFVDGCFWHGCTRCKRMPANYTAYWLRKIEGNLRRDRAVTRTLRGAGWSVVRVWEHQIKTTKALEITVRRILKKLAQRQNGLQA